LKKKQQELALQHYQENEHYEGSHNEGGIVRMLFGLFFWEVMFADVDDVFQSPYQTYPLDLHTSWFVKNRKEWIDSLLKQIRGLFVCLFFLFNLFKFYLN